MATFFVSACLNGPSRGDQQFGTTQILSKLEFTELYVQRLKDRSPDAEISIEVDGSISYRFKDQSKHAFVDNAYAAYATDPSSLDDLLDRHSLSLEEWHNVLSDNIDIERLLPCVRTSDWAILAPDPDNLTSEQIAGDLVVRYCVDSDRSIVYAHPDQIRVLISRHPDYRERAIRNIRQIARLPEFTLGDGRAMVVNGGDYEASLILDETTWQKLHAHLGEVIIFGIPTRDLFVSVDASSPEQIAWLREQIEKHYARGPYPISKKLYRHTGTDISVFED
ncbi:MAG: hypothetical protein AAFN27_08155 [Pseudomonadota bacterium]